MTPSSVIPLRPVVQPGRRKLGLQVGQCAGETGGALLERVLGRGQLLRRGEDRRRAARSPRRQERVRIVAGRAGQRRSVGQRSKPSRSAWAIRPQSQRRPGGPRQCVGERRAAPARPARPPRHVPRAPRASASRTPVSRRPRPRRCPLSVSATSASTCATSALVDRVGSVRVRLVLFLVAQVAPRGRLSSAAARRIDHLLMPVAGIAGDGDRPGPTPACAASRRTPGLSNRLIASATSSIRSAGRRVRRRRGAARPGPTPARRSPGPAGRGGLGLAPEPQGGRSPVEFAQRRLDGPGGRPERGGRLVHCGQHRGDRGPLPVQHGQLAIELGQLPVALGDAGGPPRGSRRRADVLGGVLQVPAGATPCAYWPRGPIDAPVGPRRPAPRRASAIEASTASTTCAGTSLDCSGNSTSASVRPAGRRSDGSGTRYPSESSPPQRRRGRRRSGMNPGVE